MSHSNNKLLITSVQVQNSLDLIIAELIKHGASGNNLSNGHLYLKECLALLDIHSTCEIKEIVDYSIEEVKNHWEVIGILFPNEAISLHSRKITECIFIVTYLLKSKDKSEKYLKKWRLFGEVSMYARWADQDFNNLHPDTAKQIEVIGPIYKNKFEEFKIFFPQKLKSQLTGELRDDLAMFKLIKSWLSPNNFEEILKDNIKDNSAKMFYTWWSQSIHFSPLNQGISKVNTDFGSFSEGAYERAALDIASFIEKIADYSEHKKRLKFSSRMVFYLIMQNNLKRDPPRFMRVIEKYPEAYIGLVLLSAGKIDLPKYLIRTGIEDIQSRL